MSCSHRSLQQSGFLAGGSARNCHSIPSRARSSRPNGCMRASPQDSEGVCLYLSHVQSHDHRGPVDERQFGIDPATILERLGAFAESIRQGYPDANDDREIGRRMCRPPESCSRRRSGRSCVTWWIHGSSSRARTRGPGELGGAHGDARQAAEAGCLTAGGRTSSASPRPRPPRAATRGRNAAHRQGCDRPSGVSHHTAGLLHVAVVTSARGSNDKSSTFRPVPKCGGDVMKQACRKA